MDLVEQRAPAAAKYNLNDARPFINKSISEHTRRAYRRITAHFFQFLNYPQPGNVVPQDVLRWRDSLMKEKRASTVVNYLAVVRSFFSYLEAAGMIKFNPASPKFVPSPPLDESSRGRALTAQQARNFLVGPDREVASGARDYAIILLALRTSLRVSEIKNIRASSILRYGNDKWKLRIKVKGGRHREIPLPLEVKQAIDEYLKLDAYRRDVMHSDGAEAFVFQPHYNYRTKVYNKALSAQHIWNIVRRWAVYTGVGKLSPHDLRRTAITRALAQKSSYRQVQMMTGQTDIKTVMKYDMERDNLEQNAINDLNYEGD